METWGVDGYKEKHHIIPRCQGGGNDKANLVELTAAEHYIAHLLLVKMYPGFHNLAYPLFMMGNGLGKSMNSRFYEKVKTLISESKIGLPSPNKGKSITEEQKKKISKAKKGKPSPNKGKVMTEEQKLHLSIINTGKKLSEETRAKMRKAQKGREGKSPSKETREKISKALTGRPGRKHTEETRIKQSIAAKARKSPSPSEEHRRNLSLALKSYHAKKRERKELLQFWCAL